MAGPLDYFSPGPWTGDPRTPAPMDQITGFLQDPRGQAAMLQAGLSLMGGGHFGGTNAGRVAEAIGSGGEALTRQEEQNRREEEVQSRSELRGAQADAAAARAGTAGANADISRLRLGLQQQDIERKRDTATLQGKIRLSRMYDQYLEGVKKENANPLRTGPPTVPLSRQDWIRTNPLIKDLGLVPDESLSDSADIPAATPTPVKPKLPPPKIGEKRNGFTFKGGDPGDEANWER